MDYADIVREVDFDQLIYTGPIDAFCDYRYGKLPYRSLRFHFETHARETFQPAAVINDPDDASMHPYTRITEFIYARDLEHRRPCLATPAAAPGR